MMMVTVSSCSKLVGEWPYIVHIPIDLLVLEVEHENLIGG
jgi:hypothetical protein